MEQSSIWLSILSYQSAISWLLIGSIVGVALLMGLFVFINGTSKLESGFTGRLIQRWSIRSVIVHWLGAIPCLVLIFTGVVIGAGKVIFEPGSTHWAAAVKLSSTLHELAVFPFIFGALLMVIMWWKKQLFKKYDIDWFIKAGGYINFGKKQHPEADFANGGEKLWFWVFTINFIILSATGLMLFFSEIAPAPENAPMVISLHIISAMIIGAFAIVHIFMATVISEGGLSNMITGKCDENWAKQHHNRWYKAINKNSNEVEKNG
ncbi:formate dehydrogenase subunit gamma [Photobacterium proteolyticum]|uniref:Formate dehydrogenase subunit gamma n=1 Tax=Photobacterium proteolyticum TaxID=1903952 RepID=A0A1Q9H0Z9_9GAMM|nr:formate dehydrogenase subunit gamma [Photobacterium proteolyticum]OLQ81352.1 formate dehydrogenase subunit gamma [Photobacterium proteolyticum]